MLWWFLCLLGLAHAKRISISDHCDMDVRTSVVFTYPVGSSLEYFDVDKETEWAACTAACVAHPQCVSFVPFNATCRLASREPMPRRIGRRRPLAVLSPQCRLNATDSPTSTQAPTLMSTRRPTLRPTQRPSEYEEEDLDPDWVSPTGIKRSVPFPSDLFYTPLVEPCEHVQARMGTRKVSFKPWLGTREECYKECAFDAACDGAAYGEDECIKYDVLETTDDLVQSKRWWSKGWTVTAKKTAVVGYFSSLCSTFDQYGQCDDAPECAWNAGKRGWNQQKILTSTWCGRVKCSGA